MNRELSTRAQIVQDAIKQHGLTTQVVELPASTRTAQDASNAIGCHVGQIVKSLVFKSKRMKRAVLVLTSGANRVDERKIESLIGEPLGKADPDFVRRETGFAIGGVPPLGHKKTLPTYIDKDQLEYPKVWAAAGTPHAVFEVDPESLATITGGVICDVK